MADPLPMPGTPPADGWDTQFTCLAREIEAGMRVLLAELTKRFRGAGLGCAIQLQQTPRGLSTFLALVWQRGLLCIVEVTLVDGMQVAHEAGAALDIRLLDACGDVVARQRWHRPDGASTYQPTAECILPNGQIGACATSVYVLVMGLFGLPTAGTQGSGRIPL